MNHFNTVIIEGNLVRDCESSFTKTNNKQITKFSIANNQGFGDKKSVNFIDCVCFDKTAELCAKYLKKGSRILISGELKQNTWQDSNGQNRSKLEIIVRSVNFLPSGEKKESNNNDFNQDDSHPLSFDAPNDFNGQF